MGDINDVVPLQATEQLEPINGIVQPSVLPAPNRPGRVTNQLIFLQEVVEALTQHKDAWIFLSPVDAIKLNIPDYHKVIKQPMDLGTIQKRLENNYYWSGKDCIKDIYTMFTNCYVFNKPGDEVTVMGQTLERVFFMKTFAMPKDEVVVDSKPCNEVADEHDDREPYAWSY